VHGWELVVSGVPSHVVERLRPRVRSLTPITGDRFSIDVAADGRPEQLLAELTAAGATLVALNPIRETLEDLFVRRVAEMRDGARQGTLP
jgi:hypothetical protein